MGESNRNTTKVQSSLPMGGNERGRQTEIPSFHPDMPDMNDPLNDYEDEDLTADNPASARSKQQPEEPMDDETAEQVADIVKHINNLKYSSELSKRVESLIALNEII